MNISLNKGKTETEQNFNNLTMVKTPIMKIKCKVANIIILCLRC